jgi:hypothetical protein
MPVRDANLRVAEGAQLASHHERRHARHVALIGERDQIEHQSDVFFPILGDADRCGGSLDPGFIALLLGAHDAAFDLAHVVEIFTDAHAVARPELDLELVGALHDRVEDARVLLQARLALFRRGTVAAEHPLEDHARVDLHRQRLRRRRPADRAHVRAQEVARAAA